MTVATANPRPPVSPQPGDALVIVDVQQDFLPGGALAVPRGDEIIEPVNRYVGLFLREHLPIFATRDWHPPNHCSFREQGGPWPVHCVRETAGAAFSPLMHLPPNVEIVSKAVDANLESYSDFGVPAFDARLKQLHVRRLWVCGLATEYCVLWTVRDAIARDYQVILLTDAIRPINVDPDDGRRAEDGMVRSGAVPVTWTDVTADGEGDTP